MAKKNSNKAGKTDKKIQPEKFPYPEVTDDNLDEFLKIFPQPHLQFCLEYSKSWNAQKAYQSIHPKSKASTAKAAASRLMKDPNIQKYLKFIANKVVDKYQLSKDMLLQNLIDVRDQAMAAVPVLNEFGQPTGSFTFQANAAINAIKLLGMEMDMFNTQKFKVENINSNQVQAVVFVVPEIEPIDMADPGFQADVNEVLKDHIKKRMKE